MNERIKTEIIIYRSHRYNTFLWIWIATALVLAIIGTFVFPIDSSINIGIELLILVFAIIIHVQNRKLRIRSIASILIYIANGLSIIGAIAFISAIQTYSYTELMIYRGIGIVNLVLQIIAAVFAFLTARKLKRENPTLIQDYLEMKKQKKGTEKEDK